MTNFIYTSYLKDLSICDELIECANNSPYRAEGTTIANIVHNGKKEKESTDVNLLMHPELCQKYTDQLGDVLDEYIKEYPWCQAYGSFGIEDSMNIQHYAPTQGYHAWHTERYNHQLPNATRHLVFMTYLNDVTENGETEFFHQKLKIKPKKGLTLIFGSDWTFTHRGIPSMTQEKYIVTGWFNFMDIVEK